MENKEEFRDFLREEAETLQEKVESIEVRMSNILLKQGISSLDKLNKLNTEKEMVNAQAIKLYELIGRL